MFSARIVHKNSICHIAIKMQNTKRKIESAEKEKAAVFCKFSALLFPKRYAPKMLPHICHLLFFQQCSWPFFLWALSSVLFGSVLFGSVRVGFFVFSLYAYPQAGFGDKNIRKWSENCWQQQWQRCRGGPTNRKKPNDRRGLYRSLEKTDKQLRLTHDGRRVEHLWVY